VHYNAVDLNAFVGLDGITEIYCHEAPP